MRGSFKIIEISGIPIKLHISLILIIGLIAWSIGANISEFANLLGIEIAIKPGIQSYIIGGIMASGLLFSVFLHEMAHSITAQKIGIKVEGISLWILGGIANMEEIPRDPNAEIKISIVGPVTSLIIGIIFYTISLFSPPLIRLILLYLGILNIVLAGFNLIPAFPMDGGRILRAIFAKRGDYLKATEKAAAIGKIFAIILGIFGLFYNLFLVIIAVFIYIVAGQEALRISQETEDERIGRLLKKIKAEKIMSKPVKTVSPDLSIREFLENIINIHHTGFPVKEDDEIIGIITLGDTKGLDKGELDRKKVRDIMVKKIMSFSPGDTLDEIWDKMNEKNVGRFPIINEYGELVGIITRSDLMSSLERITELESFEWDIER